MPGDKPKPPANVERAIYVELVKTRRRLDKLVGFKYQFALGIVKGLGTTLGATVIFALLIFLLNYIHAKTGNLPIIERFFDVILQTVGD